MASIVERITDDLVAALAAITVANGYDFDVAAVEQERSVQVVSDRFPFIEVSGPTAEVTRETTTQGDKHELSYEIAFLDAVSDLDIGTEAPYPKQVASVASALQRAIMADHTRGGLAAMTRVLEYGPQRVYDEQAGALNLVIMAVMVETYIDMFDPDKLA